MTDNEIVKALECCCDYDNNFNEMRFCQVCPLYSNRGECNELLHEYTRDLINRQNAENERLKPFEAKIAEFNSHIRVENMLVFASSLGEWLEFCDNLKSEARKEFAERVKEKSWDVPYETKEAHFVQVVDVEDIDNLLKEMESEDK